MTKTDRPPFPYKLSPKILFDIPIWVLVNIEWTTIFLDTKMLEIENNVQTCLSTRHFAWIDVNCCRVCLKKSSTNNFQNKLRRHWPLEEVEYLPKVTLHQLAGLNLWLSEAYVMSWERLFNKYDKFIYSNDRRDFYFLNCNEIFVIACLFSRFSPCICIITTTEPTANN